MVGQKKFDFDHCGPDIPPLIKEGMKGGKLEIVRFDRLEECVKHIKSMPCCKEIEMHRTSAGTMDTECPSKALTTSFFEEKDPKTQATIKIIGVEIDNTSLNLEDEPFTSSTAFMMGNEGQGMTSKQMSVCDGFVRISQYGGGTASLNVSVAAGVVLHRFLHFERGDFVRCYWDD